MPVHARSLSALLFALLMAAPAAADPVRIGFMLPFSGTYAPLGNAIENGFRLYVDEQGGKLGGREIEYVRVDDASDPARANDNARRLIQREKAQLLVGTVHSGVAMALAKAARDANRTLVIPNAGAGALTGALCSPNVMRVSFTNWQPSYATGLAAANRGIRRAVALSWNYAAGQEAIAGFREGFEAGGGEVIKEITLPFPHVEFQGMLTETAALAPDAVFAFFSGAGAVKFVQDYTAAGLPARARLLSTFIPDDTLPAHADVSQGILSAMHYAPELDTARNHAFQTAYAQKHGGAQADVYAVQGYDAAQLLDIGLRAVGGDLSRQDDLRTAMRQATLDSPRGQVRLSAAGNPIQDFYLREVKGERNAILGKAAEALADPARGCAL